VTEGDPTGFVRALLARDPDVAELEVKRASLEDTYMSLVHRAETSGVETSGAETGDAEKNTALAGRPEQTQSEQTEEVQS
jgi:ABC-2 type transport system ATP-binding protein